MLGGVLRSGTLLVVLTALAPVVAQADPTPPELFVSEGNSSGAPGNTPVWVPLDGARMTGAGRYRLGVKLQASTDSLHRAYVVVRAATGPQVPSNGASVTNPGPASCAGVRGNPGDIVEWGSARYYGDGAYSLTAALADYAPGPCPTGGADTSGAFNVDARPAVTIVDSRAHDSRPAGPFRGVRVVPTTDGLLPEAVCGRDPVVQPDGSLKGSVVTRSDELDQPDGTFGFPEADAFPDSGSWACVARAIGGPDNLHTGWSAPVVTTLHGDFEVRYVKMLDKTYPTYAARFRVDRGAAGELVTFSLRSCGRYSRGPTGRRLTPKRLTLRARVGPSGNATVRFRRRVKNSQFGRYFVGPALFPGNSLIPKGRTRHLFAFSEYIDSFDGPLLGVYDVTRC